jgi:hypothetical protein
MKESRRPTGLAIFSIILGVCILGGVYLERATRPAASEEPRPTATPLASHQAATPPSFQPFPQAALPPGKPGVGEVLADPEEDHVRIAKRLRDIVTDAGYPLLEREEALAHTLNLAAGNEAEVLAPMVSDPRVPDNFAENILAEALNSSLAYQADLYLRALQARSNPELQKMIREHLAFLTGGEDRGSDLAAWRRDLDEARKTWGD